MTYADDDLLDLAAGYAKDYLAGLPTRPVGPTATAPELQRLLGGPLPDLPSPPEDVVGALAAVAAAGGVVASSGPRFFGFVVGGTLPVALAADWLVSTWDQNSGVYDLSPAAATAEEVAARWLVDLLGLPAATSVGFPTGCAMAHVTALAAARHHVLAEAGWDVERDGLQGAPTVNVVASTQRHLTIDLALRYLGIGTARVVAVGTDGQGVVDVRRMAEAIRACTGPTIVCTQVGDVNSGAADPVGEICDIAHERGAWVHVDGAFGLWAAASPALRHLVTGIERADSWASDAHKLLNVPYDCGLAFVSRPDAHRAAMLDERASYLPSGDVRKRDPIEWVPDFSRRARSLPVWAALRALGRQGVAEQVERCCALARRFADQLSRVDGVEVVNDVVLNQAMVRFGGDDDATGEVVTALQEGGVCWLGSTRWNGRAAMRISVTSWRTTEADVDLTVAEIRRVWAETRGSGGAADRRTVPAGAPAARP